MLKLLKSRNIVVTFVVIKLFMLTGVFYSYLNDTTASRLILLANYSSHAQQHKIQQSEILDFENFNNITGSKDYIVPNIVHFIYLNKPNMEFYEMVSILSIYLNHKPDRIYIHCDNCDFNGKYWSQLKSYTNLWSIIQIYRFEQTQTVFGMKYGWLNHHRSDVYRLLVLMNYGGIFLDNDVYVVNSLDKYRKYEMTVSWDSDADGIGVQVLIAHRNARLLKAHYDSYRYNYTPSQWYWNAGYVPAQILLKHRYLAHAVKIQLGTHMLSNELYRKYWPEWKTLDSIHLLMNHRHYLDEDSSIKQFNEDNIVTYNYTYGFMVRDIMDRMKHEARIP